MFVLEVQCVMHAVVDACNIGAVCSITVWPLNWKVASFNLKTSEAATEVHGSKVNAEVAFRCGALLWSVHNDQ